MFSQFFNLGRTFDITIIPIGNVIRNKAVCISLHANALEKGMNPSVFLLTMGKW